MAPERKLYQDLRKNTCSISLNRIENLSLLGMPDVLGYNSSGHFFTVELKVAKGNKVRFSPHQIAFHKSHPKNTFILARTLGPCSLKLIPGAMVHDLWSMGHGAWSSVTWLEIQKLFNAWGLKLGAWAFRLDACSLHLLAGSHGPWPTLHGSYLF